MWAVPKWVDETHVPSARVVGTWQWRGGVEDDGAHSWDGCAPESRINDVPVWAWSVSALAPCVSRLTAAMRASALTLLVDRLVGLRVAERLSRAAAVCRLCWG